MAAVVIVAVLALILSQAPGSHEPMAEAAAYETASTPDGVVSRVAQAEVRPCPPLGGGPLERDLTVPYLKRTYLLDDGSLCRPEEGFRSADAR